MVVVPRDARQGRLPAPPSGATRGGSACQDGGAAATPPSRQSPRPSSPDRRNPNAAKRQASSKTETARGDGQLARHSPAHRAHGSGNEHRPFWSPSMTAPVGEPETTVSSADVSVVIATYLRPGVLQPAWSISNSRRQLRGRSSSSMPRRTTRAVRSSMSSLRFDTCGTTKEWAHSPDPDRSASRTRAATSSHSSTMARVRGPRLARSARLVLRPRHRRRRRTGAQRSAGRGVGRDRPDRPLLPRWLAHWLLRCRPGRNHRRRSPHRLQHVLPQIGDHSLGRHPHVAGRRLCPPRGPLPVASDTRRRLAAQVQPQRRRTTHRRPSRPSASASTFAMTSTASATTSSCSSPTSASGRRSSGAVSGTCSVHEGDRRARCCAPSSSAGGSSPGSGGMQCAAARQ